MSTLMVRAFLAFELSPEMRQQLAGTQAVLHGCHARLTFVDPAIIHITVKFLGEVDEKKMPQADCSDQDREVRAVPGGRPPY